MVKKVSQSYQNAYIQKQFNRLPSAEKGNTRQVKAGENLWSIAKSELGENASNKEINDYVFLIAKVNDLNTDKKMNQIRANANLYMPKQIKDDKKPVATTIQANPTPKQVKPQAEPVKSDTAKPEVKKELPKFPEFKVQNYVSAADGTRVANNQFLTLRRRTEPLNLQKKVEVEVADSVEKNDSIRVNKPEISTMKEVSSSGNIVKPSVKKRNSVETSFIKTLNTLFQDPSVKVTESNIKLLDNEKLYFATNTNTRPHGQNTPNVLLTFNVKSNGQVSKITFEGENDINPNGMDYVINNNGKKPSPIMTKPYLTTKSDVVGQVSPEEFQALSSKLLTLIK